MKKGLRKELLQQGASASEAENLARLAGQLAVTKPRGLSARARRRIHDQLPINAPKERRPAFRWTVAGSLAGAMALIALLVLPGILQTSSPTQPGKSDVRTLVQPVETELQELDMQVEQLQQQPTVNEAELKEAEEKYRRTFERFKNRYQNRKEFQNYDWDKWRRDFQGQNQRDNTNDANAGPDQPRTRPSRNGETYSR